MESLQDQRRAKPRNRGRRYQYGHQLWKSWQTKRENIYIFFLKTHHKNAPQFAHQQNFLPITQRLDWKHSHHSQTLASTVRFQSLALNINCKIFACKHSSKLVCSRKLETQSRHDQLDTAYLQRCSSRATYKWDKTRSILSVTHAGTQTPCVTQLVTHCCPPALLTQLCTSVMGLGLKTAGETTQPCSNNKWGLGLCVGGMGVWTGPSNYCTLWHLGLLNMSA